MAAGACCSSPTARSRRPPSWSVGILDHQHGTRDLRRLPRPASGWGTGGRGHARRRSIDGGHPADVRLHRQGGVLRRPRRARRWPASSSVRCSPRPTASASLRAPSAAWRPTCRPASDTARPPAPRSWLRPPCWRWSPWSSGVVPGLLDPLVDAPQLARHAHRRRCTSPCGTGSTSPSCCRSSPSAGGAVVFAAGPAVGRRATAPTPVPSRRRRLPGHAPRRQRAGQPRHGRRPAGIAARLPRRHPLHRRRRARGAAAHRSVVERVAAVRPDPGSVPLAGLLVAGALAAAIVRRRFAGALLLGLVGYAMAGLFVAPGRTGPGPHPGRHRDPDDGAVRARAAPPARPVRAQPGRPPGAALSPWRRRWRGRVRADARRRQHRPADVPSPTRWSSDALPEADGAQRGERHPRRLPRPRHARRDHRPHRGRHRHGGPGPRRSAADASQRRAGGTGRATARADRPAS